MNYLTIYPTTIADGPNVRVSIYVSGCCFHCKGCHNPESWDFNAGQEFTDETLDELISLCDHDYIRGLSILGGEPLAEANRSTVAKIIFAFKQRFPDKDIWMWTGYTYNALLAELDASNQASDVLHSILSEVDVLVVGPFVLEQRDITKENLYRGSTNQRVVDVKASLATGKCVYLPGIPNNS